MALSAVLPAMNGGKTLHSFFTKPSSRNETDVSTSGDEIAVASNTDQVDGATDGQKEVSRRGRPRKSRVSTEGNGKTQQTLQELVKPKSINSERQDVVRELEIPDSCSSETLFSSPRSKRRRTSKVEYVEAGEGNDATNDVMEPQVHATPRGQSSPQVVIPASSAFPAPALEPCEPASKTPPKKMLRLNANGKFSSPISKTPKDEGLPVEVPKKRGRPRKSKEPDKEKHLIVTIRYSNVAATGSKIGRILSGEERIANEVKIATPKKQRTPRKQKPSRPTHPFFLGKPKDEQPQPKQVSPRKTSAVTPGKLRRQTMSERLLKETSTRPAQDYVVGSGLLKDRLMFKHPGAKEPSWPTKEQTHVRGLGASEVSELKSITKPQVFFGKRKRKAANIPFPAEDSLLKQFTLRLKPEIDGTLRLDGFRDPHPSLTLPKKLLVPGQEIARRVACELSAPLAKRGEDELARPMAPYSVVHPAIETLFNRIPMALSAVDEGRGEAVGWTQKYEPSSTAEVLQPSREMNVLKSWLTSLTVTSVEGATKVEPKFLAKSETKPKKKRRRKNNDLDDFLVDDDEDVRDMDELSEAEDTSSLSTDGRKVVRSVVQAAGDGVKLSNAVLLSGPSGCGKTAAAYAVAKELGFKVFEISPCERRSGRDVIDKVGDMTENHLVRHHGTETAEQSSAEEPSRNDEALQRDLASGRQGKMNAFFKPKAVSTDASPKKKKAVQKKNVVEAVKQAIKKPPKDQQQSLILLEEVDILFKDDKDFWNTIFRLIQSSKRPFIMTCNDEDLVPLQAMSLHAILRFSPPPVELVTDYLLLVAASEGHLLRRDAVQSLYQSKGRDLRAAIAELDFWCQMGVGDPRGGLSWIFQRYPPGSDLDAEGRKLRVVSEGTYKAGMGLLPDPTLGVETPLLWARHEFGIDPASMLSLEDPLPENMRSLQQFTWVAESISAADIYGGKPDTNALDTTQPPMPDKARSQYIEGMTLLQTDGSIDYAELPLQLATAIMLAAHNAVATRGLEDIHSQLKASIQLSKNKLEKRERLARRDFACFDAIAVPSENTLSTAPGLLQSAFDGPLECVTTDLAPYVRSIVQFDLALAEHRERLTDLTSDIRHAKRARTTRAARSALEGGQRASTRRERWFTKGLDVEAVLATAGEDWPKTGLEVLDAVSREGTETPASSAEAMQAA